MDGSTNKSIDLPSSPRTGQSRIDNHSMTMLNELSQWNDKRPDANEAMDASSSGLTEYTGVQLLPSGVKILKKGNGKGEPGDSVAKLIGKINSKNLLKQKAKKARDTIPSPKSSTNPVRDKNKYERGKQKKNASIRQTPESATNVSPFKLPKPHYAPPQQAMARQKETSQCEISYQLQTNHPLTIQRLAAPSAPPPIDNASHSAPALHYSIEQASKPTTTTTTTTTTKTTDWWKEITILIHLIDGFEIEEADAPFPVGKEPIDDDQIIDRPIDNSINESSADNQPDLSNETRQYDNVESMASVANDEKQFLEPPPAKLAKHSPMKASSPEVKRESESSPSKCANLAVQDPVERNDQTPLRTSTSEEDDEDSISIGSKENATREEMMNVDYASSPPSHSPVSFPLRDVSSTDSFPSHHHLDTELVDEKPAIFLCEPDGDKRIEEWTEQDVYHFISGIEGCSQYAEEFISQEIDGQALVLLNEDHLMTNLNVKLGPALKILAKIQENKK